MQRMALLGVGLLVACGPKVAISDGGGSGADGTGGPTSGPMGASMTNAMSGPVTTAADTGGTGGSSGEAVLLHVNQNVDVLFVIDNSLSMGEEQSTLAANMASFVDVLELLHADYRIGVTTTDNGNPWCSGTTPEGGTLRATSCRSRAGEFVAGGVDATQEACLDRCLWDTIDIAPTVTAADPVVRPRPWLQRTGSTTNIAGGTCAAGASCGDAPTATEALACLLPQGIDGCDFEQPLESMYKTLLRAQDDNEDGFDFIRANAVLAVVVISDEADCSYDNAQETIFSPDGDRTFWSDQTAAVPTSAVCWNAGVSCNGSDCEAVNLDPLGNPTSEDEAVMRPVSRYIDQLQALEDQKQELEPDQQVLVSLVTGVGPDGSVTYQDSLDPDFQNEYGIGPGCTSDAGQAIPPVRMRQLAEAFAVGDQQNMFSICGADYTLALDAAAAAIAEQLHPTCMPACVADTDPTTQVLEPSCVLTQETAEPDGSISTIEIPPCTPGGLVPAGDDVCFRYLVDGSLDATGQRHYYTDDDSDDLSNKCAEAGWNLEVEIVRAEGAEPPGPVEIRAQCQLSQSKQIDCPGLP